MTKCFLNEGPTQVKITVTNSIDDDENNDTYVLDDFPLPTLEACNKETPHPMPFIVMLSQWLLS